MCLDTLLPDEKPIEFGYKVFVKDNENLIPLFYGKPKTLGVWYHAQPFWKRLFHIKRKIETFEEEYKNYEAGFHVYHDIKDAECDLIQYNKCNILNRVIVYVQVKNPICVGIQHNAKITVAKQMKILRIVR